MTSFKDISPIRTRIGEVVECSSDAFTVHCYQLYDTAPLGSLVRTIGDNAIYAIVHNVSTSSIDPGRQPVARGEHEIEEEDVYRSNPQLPRLLRTNFQATIVGYEGSGGIRYHLPPKPPRIHAFVLTCKPTEVLAFSESMEFLPLLLTRSSFFIDEVIAAFLRQAATAHEEPATFLMGAARQLARLLQRDVQRLHTLITRLHP